MENDTESGIEEAIVWLGGIIPLEWSTLIQIGLVIFATAIADLAIRQAFIRFERRAQETDRIWDDALSAGSRLPVRLAVWLIGITFAIELIDEDVRTTIFDFAPGFRDISLILLIAWALIRSVRGIEKNLVDKWYQEEEPIDQTTVDAVSKLIRATIMVTAGLVILQTLGFTLTSLLAFGGIGGLALGFAAQDLLSNFFGGLTIYLERPFKVGDWVRSPDREIEGAVEVIGWRRTVIRTFDLRPLYVPNSVFNQVSLENPSRMLHRRIFEIIGVRYDDFNVVKPIVDDIRTMLEQHEEITLDRTLIVNFTEFSESSLDIFIYCFTKTKVWTEFHGIKEDILLRIGTIIQAHGAEIAYPTRTLHVPDGVAGSGGPPVEPRAEGRGRG